jgi:hypothetical protein
VRRTGRAHLGSMPECISARGNFRSAADLFRGRYIAGYHIKRQSGYTIPWTNTLVDVIPSTGSPWPVYRKRSWQILPQYLQRSNLPRKPTVTVHDRPKSSIPSVFIQPINEQEHTRPQTLIGPWRVAWYSRFPPALSTSCICCTNTLFSPFSKFPR